jgi:hypothetical protein
MYVTVSPYGSNTHVPTLKSQIIVHNTKEKSKSVFLVEFFSKFGERNLSKKLSAEIKVCKIDL